MKPIIMQIEDEIDLHTFLPKEVPDLLPEYFRACIESGIFAVRVIHGKGQGMLKSKVRSILKKCPLVQSFNDASPEAGGWGATLVQLNRDKAVDGFG